MGFLVLECVLTNSLFRFWVHISKRLGLSRDCRFLDFRVSNRGEQHPVGTRFCSAKSSVLYLLRPLTLERGCHRTGQTVSRGSRRTDICKRRRLADIRSSGVGGAAKRRSEAEAMLHHRGSKRYIKPAAATYPRTPNTTTVAPTTRCPEQVLPLISLCFRTDENASQFPSEDVPHHRRSQSDNEDTVPLCPRSY